MYRGDTSDGQAGANGGPSGGAMAQLRLGDYLVEQGLITAVQLEDALARQRAGGSALLGEILTQGGLIEEDTLGQALARIAKVPYLELRTTDIDSAAVQAVPRDIPPRYGVVPIAVLGERLRVAFSDPFNILAIDEIERRTSFRVEPVCSPESDVRNAIERYYGGAGVLEGLVTESVQQQDEERRRMSKGAGMFVSEPGATDDEPIVRLVDEIINQAARRRATDIHVDPEEESVRVRFRIDGMLHPGPMLPKGLQQSLISRVKVLAELDIAEQRLPQEGHITYQGSGREIDLRVSSFPTVFGEKVAMRLLHKQMLFGGLADLGLEGTTLDKLEDSMTRTKGIVLLTGPTGSGKTTTLYTMLSRMNMLTNNIVTLEDPVEYRIPQVRQSQINNRAGFSFATGIRSVLRQDPDVILLGEIRDPETAGLAMRAALTGILVFSTLHTNEAAGTFPRLVDMGLEPYLIGSTMISTVAERLVRRVCRHCAEPVEPDAGLLQRLGLENQETDGTWLRGQGCRSCDDSGYQGRVGIFEILMVSPAIREAIKRHADTQQVRKLAVEEGMQTLMQHGLSRVLRGETTLEELARVARE